MPRSKVRLALKTKVKRRKGIRLTGEDLDCIDDHVDDLFNVKRPTKQYVKHKVRLILEHLTGELTGKLR